MSPLMKILLPLAVLLPLGGFVVGSLASAASDEPPARAPIVLRDDTDSPAPIEPTDDSTPRPRDDDSPPDDDGRGDDDEDDDRVITPTPYDDDHDDADDRGDDDGGDDDDDGGDDDD